MSWQRELARIPPQPRRLNAIAMPVVAGEAHVPKVATQSCLEAVECG